MTPPKVRRVSDPLMQSIRERSIGPIGLVGSVKERSQSAKERSQDRISVDNGRHDMALIVGLSIAVAVVLFLLGWSLRP